VVRSLPISDEGAMAPMPTSRKHSETRGTPSRSGGQEIESLLAGTILRLQRLDGEKAN
jgi:hypothetical protein